MKHLIGLILLAAILAVPGCKQEKDAFQDSDKEFWLDSPYETRAHTYWGQLHIHSTESDGQQSPKDMVLFYKRLGYDFVALTDHLTITRDPRVPGILFLTGIEDNADGATGQRIDQHINRIGAKHLASEPYSQTEIFAVSEREGSVAVINHPNWPGEEHYNPGWSDEELLSARGYQAIEIWNASVGTDDGSRADLLLRSGRRAKLMATDDCHDLHDPTCATTKTVVYADALSERSIMRALRAGNYYSSNGAHMSVEARGVTIRAYAPYASDIEFIGGTDGDTLKKDRACTTSEYRVRGDEIYVRVQITELLHGRKAWSNPIYVVPED